VCREEIQHGLGPTLRQDHKRGEICRRRALDRKGAATRTSAWQPEAGDEAAIVDKGEVARVEATDLEEW
jgi:hypothetical protein